MRFAAGVYPWFIDFTDVKRLRSCHSTWTGRQSIAGHLTSLITDTHLQLSQLKQQYFAVWGPLLSEYAHNMFCSVAGWQLSIILPLVILLGIIGFIACLCHKRFHPVLRNRTALYTCRSRIASYSDGACVNDVNINIQFQSKCNIPPSQWISNDFCQTVNWRSIIKLL